MHPGCIEPAILHTFKVINQQYAIIIPPPPLHVGAAMTHYHDEDEHGRSRDRHVDVSDEELFDLISSTLKEDDLDDDGYVDFFEFVKSQNKGVEPENPAY